MGSYSWSVVLVGVAILLLTGQCQDSCQAKDGYPGEAGTAGRDGWPGPKGDKGEPAPTAAGPTDAGLLLKLKGQVGVRGQGGQMGPKGYRGDLGPEGPPGQPGGQGLDGGGVNQASSPEQSQSAFSVVREVNNYPAYNRKITYQSTITNKPGDFNLNTGLFTCRVPGVYYFVFHCLSKVSMCIRLKSESQESKTLGFCDYNNRATTQVLSGGVVLQLHRNNKVWLEAFKDRQEDSVVGDTEDKQIVFNGFLLFSTS
ncbi:complement C1q subcomponent subunit A [Polymixia lowei]